jgi:hypothetical protein
MSCCHEHRFTFAGDLIAEWVVLPLPGAEPT